MRSRSRCCRRWVVGVAAGMVAALALAAGAQAAPPIAGGGFVAGYQVLSLAELNDRLQAAGMPSLGEAVWLWGGRGMGPAGLPRPGGGLMAGGFGAGGELKAVGDGGKETRLAIGYGGPWVGVQQDVLGTFWLQAGLGVALGGATLEVYTASDAPSLSLTTPNEVTYERFILALVPELGLGITLTPFMHLVAGAAYFFDTGIGGEWKSARGAPVAGAPKEAMSGLQARLALVWGPDWWMEPR